MQASNVSQSTLEAAAAEVGVSLDMTCLNLKGTRHRVKVSPLVPDECYTKSGRRRAGDKGNAPYQRESAGYSCGRRVHAVCWHGFRDFFRAVYAIEPDAVFRTALDTWKGSEDFEDRFAASGRRNIGSPVYPFYPADACRCDESGYAG